MSTRSGIGALLRARPRSGKYGAPMGRSNVFADDYAGPLYCQRVPFVDGDYSPDGTYWGGGRGVAQLWAVFSPDFEVLCFYRAAGRMAAVREFDTEHGDARRVVMQRCEPCCGMGYKGRMRRGAWKVETCRACGGTGQRPAKVLK